MQPCFSDFYHLSGLQHCLPGPTMDQRLASAPKSLQGKESRMPLSSNQRFLPPHGVDRYVGFDSATFSQPFGGPTET